MTTFRANAIKKQGDPNPGFSRFTYIGYPINPMTGPSISSVTPSIVYKNIATPLTIIGNGFTGMTDVDIDGNPCGDVVVIDDNTITCTSPTGIGSLGVVAIVVSGSGSAESTIELLDDASDKNITIDSVVPSSGDKGGGVLVTLYGTNIIDVVDVQINEHSQDAITLQYGFSLTFETTVEDVGTYDIVITTAGNTVTVVGGYTAT